MEFNGRKLRESNRFFNMDAMATFEEVFTYLHENHPSAFIDFEPNKPIFRGRIFQSEDALEIALRMPESSFGPPPPELTPSGRMNARGISVFYGATSRKMRPPVGSYVAVAEFTLLRTVRLLTSPVSKGWLLTDLAALILSIFFDMNAVVLFRISPENLLCRLFLSLKKQITC